MSRSESSPNIPRDTPRGVLRFPTERVSPVDTSTEDFYNVGAEKGVGNHPAMASLDDPVAALFGDIAARRVEGLRPDLRVASGLGNRAVQLSQSNGRKN